MGDRSCPARIAFAGGAGAARGRAFEIVAELVQSGGELVSKTDLAERVWPRTFVEEGALRVHIAAIRKAFGPDRDLLATAVGRGYRLLGTW